MSIFISWKLPSSFVIDTSNHGFSISCNILPLLLRFVFYPFYGIPYHQILLIWFTGYISCYSFHLIFQWFSCYVNVVFSWHAQKCFLVLFWCLRLFGALQVVWEGFVFALFSLTDISIRVKLLFFQKYFPVVPNFFFLCLFFSFLANSVVNIYICYHDAEP